MPLSDITIHRDFQVINGFVQVPPNNESDKNRVTVDEALSALAGSDEIFLSHGSGRNTGSKFGAQSTLRLAGNQPGTWFTTDPVDDLANS